MDGEDIIFSLLFAVVAGQMDVISCVPPAAVDDPTDFILVVYAISTIRCLL